jgi:hypothetical protein
MTSHVRAPLTTPRGGSAPGDEVPGLMRRREYAAAEAVLVDHLTEHPGPIATACRGLAVDTVEIVGWEDVGSALGHATAHAQVVTAVGLDLSNYSDAEGRDWWDKEPVVELSLYDDTHFPFSTSTPRQLRQAAGAHPAPWTGHRLVGRPVVLAVRGLRALNGALLQDQAERPWSFGVEGRSFDTVAGVLGGWWMVLRFHQAVARDWPEVGPVLGVPVLVGQRGTGPWQVSVFTPAGAGPDAPRDNQH